MLGANPHGVPRGADGRAAGMAWGAVAQRDGPGAMDGGHENDALRPRGDRALVRNGAAGGERYWDVPGVDADGKTCFVHKYVTVQATKMNPDFRSLFTIA